MSPMQSPDRSSQSTSSLASVPLSPYMKQKPSPLAGPFLDDYSPISRVHAGRGNIYITPGVNLNYDICSNREWPGNHQA